MAENMGTYHLADNPQLYEPARSNNFEFIVMDIDELLRAGTKASGLEDEKNYIKKWSRNIESFSCCIFSSSFHIKCY